MLNHARSGGRVQFIVATASLAGVLLSTTVTRAADNVAGNLMLINDNGAWSWFEDERAIVDESTGNVLVGSIGNGSGTDGPNRTGSVEVASFNLATRRVSNVSIGAIRPDDHNTPALLVRSDGRYLATFANHNSDRRTRTMVSEPGNPRAWSAVADYVNSANTTYNNVFRVAGENKLYNFTRTVGFDPNYLISIDEGVTWAYGGKLLQDPANSDSTRPYLKYASNHLDRVDFITTEGHPRDFNNGIYHGYMQGGKLYHSNGTPVGNLAVGAEPAPAANAFTPLFKPSVAQNHAWTTDLALDAGGNPVAVFTTRANNSTADHRFFYGRFTGGTWQVNEMAKAGAGLYTGEMDYTGLAAINPRDPDTVYISSNVNPRNDAALAKHEIFKGVTGNNGASWNWTPITQNSTVDNLRPVIPSWSNGTAVMWMRGTYTTYTNYDLAIVGLVEQDGNVVNPIRYTDATLANTMLANGSALITSGPTNSGGPTDNQWHRRNGFGNGNQVFTAGETGDENAPLLKTTIADVAAGEYDVFGFFWANPIEEWQIALGLSEDEMRTFRQDFAEQADGAEFDGPMVLVGDTVNLYKAYLGRVTLLADGSLPVFVDDSPFGLDRSTRTWFDGVGIAAVPEPSSVVGLGALAALALGRRRRRATMPLCPR